MSRLRARLWRKLSIRPSTRSGRRRTARARALDVCETENPTRDTTHRGARLTAPVTVCRKRPFTTQADRLRPRRRRPRLPRLRVQRPATPTPNSPDTFAFRACQRLRRPPLVSGPSGDYPGPLRLRRRLGPSGSLPARQDKPGTVRRRLWAGSRLNRFRSARAPSTPHLVSSC